jgi:hypothetical protein
MAQPCQVFQLLQLLWQGMRLTHLHLKLSLPGLRQQTQEELLFSITQSNGIREQAHMSKQQQALRRWLTQRLESQLAQLTSSKCRLEMLQALERSLLNSQSSLHRHLAYRQLWFEMKWIRLKHKLRSLGLVPHQLVDQLWSITQLCGTKEQEHMFKQLRVSQQHRIPRLAWHQEPHTTSRFKQET